ncbi:hypothetical protein L484_027075 [Morus notabilis]|uniref:Bifunctional inhibitor/plant lipid transfer protein/seed storage helical domain-containing protein n=1 Tax=Morus notabilis TaxID=981085 RepID=W9S8X9_9ROSA|nr:hypothetical protein L484_027075 [Morus notabilis]
MKKLSCMELFAVAVVLVAAVLISEPPVWEAGTCNALDLISCQQAFSQGSTPPSATCCNKLKVQVPCFCEYAKNPNLRKYFDSPNADKVSSACGVPRRPSCK